MGLDLPRDDPDVVAGRPLMGPNVFPDDMPHMRDAMTACRDAVATCAARLLRAIAVALSLPADFFDAMYDKPLVRLSANYYPPLPPGTPQPVRHLAAHGLRSHHPAVAGRPRRPRAQTPFGELAPRPAETRHLRGQHRRSSRAVDQRPLRLDRAPGSQFLRPRTPFARLLPRSPPGHRGRVHRIVPRAGRRTALSGHDVRGVHSIAIRRGVRLSQAGPRRSSRASLTSSTLAIRCTLPLPRVRVPLRVEPKSDCVVPRARIRCAGHPLRSTSRALAAPTIANRTSARCELPFAKQPPASEKLSQNDQSR